MSCFVSFEMLRFLIKMRKKLQNLTSVQPECSWSVAASASQRAEHAVAEKPRTLQRIAL